MNRHQKATLAFGVLIALLVTAGVATTVHRSRAEATRPFEIGDTASVKDYTVTIEPQKVTFDAQGHAQLVPLRECTISPDHNFKILAWASNNEVTVEVWRLYYEKVKDPANECEVGVITRVPRDSLAKYHQHTSF